MPNAYGLYISSPSSHLDKSMRLYKQSQTSTKIYGFKHSTWEINPNITKDDLKDKYAEDPIAAERDFGANPPFSSSPYIKGPASLVPCFSNKKNIFELKKIRTTKDSLGGRLIYPIIHHRVRHSYPSVLAVDCGYSNNSFALALCHWLPDKDDSEVRNFACSGLIEIKPTQYPVSYPMIYEYAIKPILEEFNVKLVAFDRWQSINLCLQCYTDN